MAAMRAQLGNLSPVRMMQEAELRQAMRLLRSLEGRDRKWWAAMQSGSPASVVTALREKRQEVEDQLQVLAGAIIDRQLGVRKYMVLELVRDDGHQDRFQVLAVTLRFHSTYSARLLWLWNLQGRSLRKDGSLGSRPGGMSLEAGTIRRRRLDGTWTELVPTYQEA